MKNKNIIMMIFAMVLLIGIVGVNAEIYLFNDVLRDNTLNITNFHAFYQFQDTSVSGIGANQDTQVTFWYTVQALPLVSGIGTVDYCNFTIKHYRNSTLIEQINYSFVSSPLTSSTVTILMRDKDSVTADMKCHFTNNEDMKTTSLAGDFTTYMSSYQCTQCIDYSLEQLSNEAQRNENITANNIGIYNSIQKVVNFNFQIWLIISWVLKIGFILLAVALIFGGVYYFYVFFSNIGKELNR